MNWRGTKGRLPKTWNPPDKQARIDTQRFREISRAHDEKLRKGYVWAWVGNRLKQIRQEEYNERQSEMLKALITKAKTERRKHGPPPTPAVFGTDPHDPLNKGLPTPGTVNRGDACNGKTNRQR